MYEHLKPAPLRLTQGFSVTYEIVTQESAEYGDAAERGFHAENVSFRQAMSDIPQGHIEANCYPIDGGVRWFTSYGETDCYGETESISLHLPDNITPSSRLRIARYLECYGTELI